jgi:hypothetical protein
MAFEKEIEHIKNISDGPYLSIINGQRKYVIEEYLRARIKEINEKYGEEPVRE